MARVSGAPDILYAHPAARRESRRIHELLTFCFARGESEERLVELLSLAPRPSTFSPDAFAGDLFLDELIGAFTIEVGGKRLEPSRASLKKLLVAPPDLESALLRQAVLRELDESGELLRGVENAYQEVRAFRRALAATDSFGGKASHLRRRVELLIRLKASVIALRDGTRGSTSLLRRVHEWASEVTGGEAFERLVRLLDFEDQRSVIESRLQIGLDGTLRRFDVVRVLEASHRGFSRGRLSRFGRAVWSLVRGYRFSEEDVLSQLLDRAYTDLEAEVVELLALCPALEFYLGARGFRHFLAERKASSCLPTFAGAGEESPAREIVGLSNPWLVIEGQSAVPVDDLESDAATTVIVTGPNSGGKTRLLQAVAVAQLLGQVGAYVPARSARLVWVEQLFLSLHEHPDAGQKEGRLGSELLRIRKVFEHSGPRSMIVMDELCSGTNPSEGEQIFEMVIDLFLLLRPQVLISTHFLDFASRLAARPAPGNLRFRQVELGAHDLPTYGFVPGVARTSLARNTASRLGVTQDELLVLVERHLESARQKAR